MLGSTWRSNGRASEPSHDRMKANPRRGTLRFRAREPLVETQSVTASRPTRGPQVARRHAKRDKHSSCFRCSKRATVFLPPADALTWCRLKTTGEVGAL